MSDPKPLQITEQQAIAKSLLNWLNEYEFLPERIQYQYLPKGKRGISLESTNGAIKIYEDVTGGYTGQFPFAILYKVMPDDSEDKISAESLLEDIGLWMESKNVDEYPNIGDNREITLMSRNTIPTIFQVDEDGSIIYQAIYNLEYKAK